jgi:hypothetical protein
MRVSYTLPGILPEASQAAADAGEHGAEAFATQLQRLRAPECTDWRALLRLNAPPAGLAGIGPPPAPPGTEWRDAASERAWWRGMLEKHTDTRQGDEAVRRMLDYLEESQRREEEIFARQAAEERD